MMITRSMAMAHSADFRSEFNDRPERLVRVFESRATVLDSDSGGIQGVAIQLGSLDSYRSVFSPNAFDSKCLREFVSGLGFISDGHDWSDDLATISEARVVGRDLRIVAEWYDTADAQQMRVKCKNRIDRGKAVGFSVGCMPDWSSVMEFDSGKKLWEYADKVLKEDMSLYDPSIRKFDGWCWLIAKVKRLVEVAVTLVPSVPGSMVTDTRSDDLANDPPGVSFAQELDLALGAVARVAARAGNIAEMRAEKGGKISGENLGRIVALRDHLSGLIEAQAPEPSGSGDLSDVDRRLEGFDLNRRLARFK